MKKFIKAVQIGDTVKFQAFGVTVHSKQRGGECYHNFNMLTPNMKKDLNERIKEL